MPSSQKPLRLMRTKTETRASSRLPSLPRSSSLQPHLPSSAVLRPETSRIRISLYPAVRRCAYFLFAKKGYSHDPTTSNKINKNTQLVGLLLPPLPPPFFLPQPTTSLPNPTYPTLPPSPPLLSPPQNVPIRRPQNFSSDEHEQGCCFPTRCWSRSSFGSVLSSCSL